MPASHETEALRFLDSAIQHLAHFVHSRCPRAERQARMALERLEGLPSEGRLDSVCEAIEGLLDRAARS
ncbi:MAG TPA: hypothetical protein PLN31_02100 [Azoarcus taiwanensis]|nr:hypothetical protein [Azoarcus taiwanensis]